MQTKRPVHLNLLAIRMPITAIASIAHRISGVLLFLSIPLAVWALHQSVISAASFDALRENIAGLYGRIVVSAITWVFIYHLLAGIRHLLMDAHIGETAKSARRMVMGITVLMLGIALILGYWVFGGI